jgi:CDP-diacylglycerol--glycerol-3-phosphate 3-phosphatidyltransferase
MRSCTLSTPRDREESVAMENLDEPAEQIPSDARRSLLNVPNTFCAIRLAGSFALLALAPVGNSRWFLIVFLFLALTDFVDGKLAIWLNQRTTFGARFDSIADAAMYGSLLIGIIWLKGDVLAAYAPWIAAALVCYALSCASSLVKFGKLPSHHTYSAKSAWMVTVLSAVALLSGWATWPVALASSAVAIANLESTAITLLSDEWRADVASVWRARRAR